MPRTATVWHFRDAELYGYIVLHEETTNYITRKDMFYQSKTPKILNHRYLPDHGPLFHAVFFFPMLVSKLPTTQTAANTLNMPRVMTIGFRKPAVQG